MKELGIDAEIMERNRLAVSSLDKKIEKQDIMRVAEIVQDALKIEPEWVRKDDPEIGEMRSRLKTEGGLIISNHPNLFLDSLSIIRAMRDKKGVSRDDIKILVRDDFLKLFQEFFGKKYFVSDKELINVSKFKEILGHIENGGVFVIFPTGGKEAEIGDIKFQKIFTSFIKKIDSSKMVYSFFVEPDDVRRIKESRPELFADYASAVLSSIRSESSGEGEKEKFRVNENYSTADEWQEVIALARPEKREDSLTNHYLGKFINEH